MRSILNLMDSENPELGNKGWSFVNAFVEVQNVYDKIMKEKDFKNNKDDLYESLKSLNVTLEEFAVSSESSKFKGLRPLLKKVHTTLKQILFASVYHDGSVTKFTKKELMGELKNELFNHPNVRSLKEKFSEIVDKEAMKRTSNLSIHNEDVDVFERLSSKLSGYKKFLSRMPTSLKGKPFTIVEAPVIPMFKDVGAMMDADRLRRMGFKVDEIGDGFIVFKDQYLLVVDRKHIERDTGMKKDKEGKIKVSQRNGAQTAKLHDKNVGFLVNIIARFNERSHIKYSLGSNTIVPNPRSKDSVLVWLIKDSQRHDMLRMFRTNEVDWGLPFSLDTMVGSDD